MKRRLLNMIYLVATKDKPIVNTAISIPSLIKSLVITNSSSKLAMLSFMF